MSGNKNKTLFTVVALVLCGGVCLCLIVGAAAIYMYGFPAQPAPSGEPPSQPGINLPSLPGVLPTPTVFQTPEAQPVGFYEGLASLNSYRMTIHMLFTGPAVQDYKENTQTTSYNQEGDQVYSRVEVTASSVEEPKRETVIIEQYRVNQTYCQRTTSSDGETSSEVSTTTSSQQSMTDAMFNLFDVTIAAEDAQFVGAEMINSIPCNHFTFTVSGLGTSGSEVTQSQGEYWVAQDGQYLVKYRVTLEMRSGPPGDANTEVTHVEIQTEVSDINTPITIQMPPDCIQ